MTSARSARMEIRGEDRIAVLSNGQRLETTRNQPGLKISEFEEYSTRIGSAPPGAAEEFSVKTRSTLPCWRNPCLCTWQSWAGA